MFGVLKPALKLVPFKQKKLYQSSYCNLCASLSASGFGVLNRFFLVNDVVTIDWLLRGETPSSSCTFSCHNCVKGGVIGKKKSVGMHETFLASISSYVCGLKLTDNAQDSPKIRNKVLAWMYKPFMKSAVQSLQKFNLLEKMNSFLEIDRDNELKNVSEIQLACAPTEQCYELVTLEIAKRISTLPLEFVGYLGRYFGRYIYLYDAMEDIDKDLKTNQYNVLNCLLQNNAAIKKKEAVALCLDFLKPMRLKIEEMLVELSSKTDISFIQTKMQSVFIGMENKLLKLVKPLKENDLVAKIYSFSNRGVCCNCSSVSSLSTMSFSKIAQKDESCCVFCECCDDVCKCCESCCWCCICLNCLQGK